MRCKATNSASWLFRLQQEINHNTYPWYVTFTYNDNHLPKIWTNEGNEVMTLDYEDIKKYFKRLRKNTKLSIFDISVLENMEVKEVVHIIML